MAISLNDLTPLPIPPAKTDPANFAQRADDFLGSLPGFVNEANAMIGELNKITSGLDQATPIAAWSAGTTYNFPDVVAGSDGYSYRCIATGVSGVNPVGDTTNKWTNLTRPRGGLPVGAIIPFIGGYFTNGSNGGFVAKVGNSAAEINARVSADGLRVCDGSSCSVSGDIFEGQDGRFLPNITDDRFLKGGIGAGVGGGSNSVTHSHGVTHSHDISHAHTISHTHTVDIGAFNTGASTLSVGQIPAHRHQDASWSGLTGTQHYQWSVHDASQQLVYTSYEGGGQAHDHTVDPPASWTSDASTGSSGTFSSTVSSTVTSTAATLDNKPAFLSCWYLMKVN